MNWFLSCDWGTSNLRIRLVQTADMQILAEQASDEGIAAVYQQWVNAGADETGREQFYFAVIRKYLDNMAAADIDIDLVPVVISGMASSNIGIRPLPYHPVPFNLSKPVLETYFFERSAMFPHDVLLISGVMTDNDVMRGEETQLLGLYQNNMGSNLYILPGTHSKHIRVSKGILVDFKTYMTGELFAILSKHGTLSTSMNGAAMEAESFKRGVSDANQNILSNLFKIRAKNVLGKATKQQGAAYLSGLLIGTELKDLAQDSFDKIYLYCAEPLRSYYQQAFEILGLDQKIGAMPHSASDFAVIEGQCIIFKNFIKNDKRVFLGKI